MASETDIANEALVMVGTRDSIASLNEESNEARVCKRYFNNTRDELLQMAHWGFAKKTAILSVLKTAPGTPGNTATATAWSPAYPAPPWLYEYAYPVDCLQVQMIVPQIETGWNGGVPLFSSSQGQYPYVLGPTARFEVAFDADDAGNDRKVILTNQYQAIGVYTKRVENPQLFSDLFCSAFAAALAAKITMSLTGDAGLMKTNYALANSSIVQARALDGNQGVEVIDQQAEWITFREGVLPAVDGPTFIAPYLPLYSMGL